MIKLHKITDEAYVITLSDSKEVYVGSAQEIKLTMYQLGIEWEEADIGFSELAKMGHKVAEYGVNKMFVYTSLGDNPQGGVA